MDLERAMEFILEQHAKTQTTLAEMAISGAATDRRIDRLERNLTRLARLGLRARSDLRRSDEELKRRAEEHERWIEQHKIQMQEMTDKLNGLIGYVDRLPKQPPQ